MSFGEAGTLWSAELGDKAKLSDVITRANTTTLKRKDDDVKADIKLLEKCASTYKDVASMFSLKLEPIHKKAGEVCTDAKVAHVEWLILSLITSNRPKEEKRIKTQAIKRRIPVTVFEKKGPQNVAGRCR